jgi:mannonate dehydratase
MGELFNSPHEWTPLIAERLIDYIRVPVSRGGDFTPARKNRNAGGNPRTEHGPSDVSPAGHMANVTLDLAPPPHRGASRARFPGCRIAG